MLEAPLTTPDGVVFDFERHAYTIDGKPAPGVSSILKVVDPDQYAFISAEILARASRRGQGCHELIALDCRDELAIMQLDDVLTQQWCDWDQFRQDFDFEVEYSERIVASRRHHFCGTLDLFGKLTYKKKRERWMVDVKNVAATPVMVGPQTAGYSIAAEESLGIDPATKRGVLWIMPKGGYQFLPCPDPADRAVFMSARTIHSWRERNGR